MTENNTWLVDSFPWNVSNADDDSVDPFSPLRQATKANFAYLRYFRLADPAYTKYVIHIPRGKAANFFLSYLSLMYPVTK